MGRISNYRPPFRRRREGKTNYRRRISLIKSRKLRLVIRNTLAHTIVQFVEAKLGGDLIRTSVTSRELVRCYGWKAPCGNLPTAYLTGLLAGKKAKKIGLTEAILDLGVGKFPPKSKVYGALRGVLDAGVIIPHNGEVTPDEARIRGEHIANYWESITDSDTRNRLFSGYLKAGLTPGDLPKHFDEVKAKIESE
ncbi:MAG: 50S ribosomal protein L18 [Candidatus Bathyarchaeia archaeon]